MSPQYRIARTVYACLGGIILCCCSAYAAGPLNTAPVLTGPIQVLPSTVARVEQGVRGLGLTRTTYLNGETWQALVCNTECVLVPVVLTAQPKLLTYSEDNSIGQWLAVDKPQPGELIALFQGLKSTTEQTMLTLLHRGMQRYPGTGRPGTMEIGIPSLDAENFRIVPRLVKGTGTLRIYLENNTHRQRLGELTIPEMNADFSDVAKRRDLLRWAGDLDGDRKIDLVMSFDSWVGNDFSVVLFLSSYAKDGDFVGLAGSFFLHGTRD